MKTIRKCRMEINRESEYCYSVQIWESTDAGKTFHYSGEMESFTKDQEDKLKEYWNKNSSPLRVFPIVTGSIQKCFEKTYTGKKEVPCICGYFGRACRQMEKSEGANRGLCDCCPLAEYAAQEEMKAYAFS